MVFSTIAGISHIVLNKCTLLLIIILFCSLSVVYIAFSVDSECFDHLLAAIAAEIFDFICSCGDVAENEILASYSTKINYWLSSSSG